MSFVLVGHGNSLPTDNVYRIAALLNGRTPHFSYSTPADPVTTGEPVTVTSATEFNNAADDAGTRIWIPSSFTGNIQVTANDIDVTMANSATINGDLRLGNGSYINRLRWTGGNVGRIVGDRFRDVLFDDVYALAYSNVQDAIIEHNFSSGWDGSGNPAFDRLAIINSTLELQGSPTQADNQKRWALHTSQSYEHTNLILANAKFLSNHQTVRIQHVSGLLIVDSVFNPNGTAVNGMRIHYGTNNVWIKDSWSRDLFKLDAAGAEAGPSVTNALFDNYDRYDNDDNYAFHGSMANTGEIRNSTFYGGTLNYGPLENGGGNASSSWDGTTVPDYSTVGAIR